jgi:hypothetical protein
MMVHLLQTQIDAIKTQEAMPRTWANGIEGSFYFPCVNWKLIATTEMSSRGEVSCEVFQDRRRLRKVGKFLVEEL